MPPWARWPLAYLALLGSSALVGYATPLGAGNAVFLAGAACILGSLTFIRLGGPKTRVGRDLKGKPIWDIDHKTRNAELKRGIGIFLLGLALWAVLIASLFVG